MNQLIFTLLCWHFSLTKGVLPKHHLEADRTLIVAHRGLTTKHLENTLSALTEAFNVGADGVEFDVQLTRDMVPVVFHDRDILRLTNVEYNIDDILWNQLRVLPQKSDRYAREYRISTLLDVLSAMPPNKLINVELKETTAMKGSEGMEKVVNVLYQFKNRLNLVISSFDPKILAMVHEADPDLKLGLLVDKEDTLKAYFEGISVFPYIDYINPHIDLINQTTSRWIKNLRIKLMLWGHTQLGQEDKFIADGHTALISDVVEALMP
ncbi:MAG TPA: glycerophosphodiester phosphodiesterase family protein [Myxococcota bacterium]|nr:glycerophosphodiester phosphodiesterase family protein [Myxococcota bacterium]